MGRPIWSFDPIEFLEKLAAITPRPRGRLGVIYHGVLAPRARWRAAVVRDGRPAPDATAPTADTGPAPAAPRGAWTWAVLMHRVFALDVLPRPGCGGRLRVLAIAQTTRPSCGPSSPTAGARAPRRRLAPRPPGRDGVTSPLGQPMRRPAPRAQPRPLRLLLDRAPRAGAG